MSSHQSPTSTADYIIVGGGTAGLVVANRLTENPNVHVLVLEAGLDQADNILVNVPAFFSSLPGSEVDWQYYTVPQVSTQPSEFSIFGPDASYIIQFSHVHKDIFV